MSLLSLPTELLLAITRYTPSLCDLNALVRTCQLLYKLFNTELYKIHVQQDGGSALCWAAENGQHRTLQRLLNIIGINPDISDRSCRTPLSYAAQKGDITIVRSLLSTQRVDLNYKDSLYGRSPLIWAAIGAADSGAEHLTVIQLLLKNGADLEAMGYDNRSALSWVSGSGTTSLVKLLIEKGAHPDPQLNENLEPERKKTQQLFSWREWRGLALSPLCFASWSGQDEVVRVLLDAGASIDLGGKDDSLRYKRTPLCCAAENGHESTVKILLAHGANFEETNFFERSPLSFAAEHGYRDIVELLLAQGACPESKGSYDSCPLYWASFKGHTEIVRLLLDQMAHHPMRMMERGDREPKDQSICTHRKVMDKEGSAPYALLGAADRGNVETVKLLLTVPDIDVNAVYPPMNCPPLIAAIRREDRVTEMIKALLTAEGIQVNQPDTDKNTALDWAHKRLKEGKIIQLLLERGAQRGRNFKLIIRHCTRGLYR